MKKLAIYLFAVALAFSVAGNAGADLIITPTSIDHWAGFDDASKDWKIDYIDIGGATTEKWNGTDHSSGWSDSFPCNPKGQDIPRIVEFADWETANWSEDLAPTGNKLYYDESTSGSNATIETDIGLGDLAYLLVKDGCSSETQPYWYIFDLVDLGWNGKDTLSRT